MKFFFVVNYGMLHLTLTPHFTPHWLVDKFQHKFGNKI